MKDRDDQRALEREILDYLRDHSKDRFRAKDLAKRLNLTDNSRYRQFRKLLDDLSQQGRVFRTGDLYAHKRAPARRQGRISIHPHGFGFVTVEGEPEDYYVRSSNRGNALDGDLVEIGLLAQDRGSQRREAEVVNVLERVRKQTVGTFHRRGKVAFVHPDDARIPVHVFVAPEDFAGAEEGQKVVVSIDEFTDGHESPQGRVLSVLGSEDDPEVRVLALALSLDIRADFPDEVDREAKAIPDTISENDLRGRLDLRGERIFTIDPVDAKDFDDAIHLKRLPDGDFEVGVHIADVSHYVRPGTELDKEAYARGTSVYLVDRVIPMLPEKLSNQICSLRPREDRLTYSCIMRVTPQGELKTWEIREAVIHSQERFTYEEAQLILDDEMTHDLALDIRLAGALAMTLTEKRMAEGSVDFDLPEVRITLDPEGRAIGVRKKERKLAHRLVEEYMLLANRAVAIEAHKRPYLYRIHEPPNVEKIEALAEYVRAFGLNLPLTGGNATSRDLNTLLSEVEGRPESIVITSAALRSMSKAKYSAHNAGHYGLGFEHYTHFTSPIRRYPDLIVHRLLKAYLAGGADADEEALEAQGQYLSGRERAATEAERESVKLKQVEYLREHLGESFDGVVAGVAKFGVFVELSEVLAEGLVHIRDLDDDFYEYDERRFTLVGRHSGRSFKPGDPLRVTVVGASLETRTIDLMLAD